MSDVAAGWAEWASRAPMLRQPRRPRLITAARGCALLALTFAAIGLSFLEAAPPSLFAFLSSGATALDLDAVVPVEARSGARGWTREGRADPNAAVSMTFLLRQGSTKELFDLATAVSDPKSPLYGQHLPLASVGLLTRPEKETTETVLRWLENGGVPRSAIDSNGNGDTISARMTVGQAERLLRAHYYVYTRPRRPFAAAGGPRSPAGRIQSGAVVDRIIRTESYRLPAVLSHHIDVVGPTTAFPVVRSVLAHGATLTSSAATAEGAVDSAASATAASASFAASSTASFASAAMGGDAARPARSAAPASTPTSVPDASAATSGGSNGRRDATPETIRRLYGIPDPEDGPFGSGSSLSSASTGRTASGRTASLRTLRQAVVGFFREKVSEKDLQTFFSRFDRSELGRTPLLERPDSEGDGVEAMLDMEYIMSVGSNVPTEFWYFPGQSPDNVHNEPFLKWLQTMSSTPELPSVFSVSYADWEPSVEEKYARRINSELAKLALRGVSVIAAAGDGGVDGAQHLPHAAWPGHFCRRGDKFVPSFPASSPWVTAVGATTLRARPRAGGLGEGSGAGPPRPPLYTPSTTGETAAALSAGGFSDLFAMPAYQLESKVVQRYFDSAEFQAAVRRKSLPPNEVGSRLWNPLGRAFPDVALLGEDIAIVYQDRDTSSSGTSAAAPTFAGMVSLINGYRAAQGKGRLGFLNPLLYSERFLGNYAGDYRPGAGVYNDVTEGSNPGCGTNGFPAARGWVRRRSFEGWGLACFYFFCACVRICVAFDSSCLPESPPCVLGVNAPLHRESVLSTL
jgi:tripeptidyl-peptidase-1